MNRRCMVGIRTAAQAQVVRDTGCEVLAEYPQQLLVECTEAQQETLEEAGLQVTSLERPPIVVSGASFEFGAAMEAEVSTPTAPDPNRTAYYLVRLVGPAKGDWLGRIRALGGAIQSNLQGYTLLVGILPARVAELEQEPWVDAITPYRPAMKVSHRLRPGVGRTFGATELASVEPEGGEPEAKEQIEITVFPGEGTASVASQVRAGGGLVLAETQSTVTAVVPRRIISGLAQEQGVQAIVPHRFPEFHNDVAAGIMDAPPDRIFGTLTLRGSDQVVGVADSGLDTGDAATIHDDFAGRIVDIVSQPNAMSAFCLDPPPYDDGPEDANSGHGTHVAGSVLANGAAAAGAGSALNPQGMAPEARLYFQAIEQVVTWKSAAQLIADGLPVPENWPWSARGLYGLPNDLNDLFNAAYLAGARIHTNSWGAPYAGLYTSWSRHVDQFMWNHRDMLIVFSAGNYGEDEDGVGGAGNGVVDEDSIGAPATAKNCLTVGATEGVRPPGSVPPPGFDADWDQVVRWFGGPLRFPQLDDAGHVSDQPDGMAAFSSRGPTDDGRRKPDLAAPGTNILSVESSRVGADPLWGDLPAGHPLRGLYCWCGGTSMSTPLVAGAAALVRQHLVQQRGHHQDGVKPSGALIKAFLVNGAESISPGQFLADAVGDPPIPATDEIPDEPSNVDGFGRANLTNTLIPGGLGLALFADEPDYAVESGQTRTFEVQAVDLGQPLKVTLAWTDAPGPADVGGLENELYLRVIDPGGAIEDGDTTPYPNATNNVQQVVIDAPVAGPYEIEVHGWNVTQQAPGASGGPNPRQDFALVVSNGMGLSLQPVSIAQAIDTTGSMHTFGYMEPAKERAGQLLDFMRINDRVSITEFSQRAGVPDARTPYPMRLLGSVDPDWDEAHAAIDGLVASGRTPIGAGLLQAYIELTAAPSTQPRAIVLLSDGQNNEPPDPDAVLPAIPSDIPIFTIALGPACSEATLRNIAESRPGGGYHAVESDEDVHKLHEIYAQVQALAAGDALVGLASAYSESGSEMAHAMPVEEGVQEVTFALSWDPSGVERMELLVHGPDGRSYDASEAATVERMGSAHHLVRVAVPTPGVWQLKIKNYGSSKPVQYTLSGAVQAPLQLIASAPKVGEEFMLLRAQLRLGEKLWRDAHVMARVTMPTVSREAILKEYGDKIREVELPDTIMEEGLDEKQILNLKLAVFAQEFRSREGGLYGRQTTDYAMTLQADGAWVAEIPITVPGHATIEIVAEGHLNGVAWERSATASAYLPEATPVRPKLRIADIVVRRSSRWEYTILGAKVVHANGKVATPDHGVTVSMAVSQGLRRVVSGDLPYYRRGEYYIWRLDLAKHRLRPGPATVSVQAKFRGATAAMARKVVRL